MAAATLRTGLAAPRTQHARAAVRVFPLLPTTGTVLTITVPKAEAKRDRRLQVQYGDNHSTQDA